MQPLIIIFSLILTNNLIVSGHWMEYIDTNLTPFSSVNQIRNDYLSSKQASAIPIIVMLKPKRGRSLTEDTAGVTDSTTDRLHTTSDGNIDQLDLDQYLGLANLDRIALPNVDKRDEQMMPSESAPEFTVEERVPSSVSRGDQPIRWPSAENNSEDKHHNRETIDTIGNLLPHFAALSQSRPLLEKMKDNEAANGQQSFEEALKKFTNNLTNLEHNSNAVSTTTAYSNEDNGTPKKSTSNGPNSSHNYDKISIIQNGKTDKPTQNGDDSADETESQTDAEGDEDMEQTGRDNNNDDEQRTQQLSIGEPLEKSTPLISDRPRISLLSLGQKNHKNDGRFNIETLRGFKPLTGDDLLNAWIPLKNKKSQKKPMAISQRNQNQNRSQYLPSKTISTIIDQSSRKSNQQSGRRPPKPYTVYTPMMSLQNVRHSPPNRLFHTENFNAFNKHRGGYHQTFLTSGLADLGALEMHGDANKPQHTEPIKHTAAEEQHQKQGEVVGDAEREPPVVVDDKQVEMAPLAPVDDRPDLGGPHGHPGLLDHQLTCCELIGHHNPHTIQEEAAVVDDKFISGLLDGPHLHHSPHHHHHHQPNTYHSYHHQPPPPHHHKCQEEMVLPSQHFYAMPPPLPPPPHRMPFRPAGGFGLFGKPLLWG